MLQRCCRGDCKNDEVDGCCDDDDVGGDCKNDEDDCGCDDEEYECAGAAEVLQRCCREVRRMRCIMSGGAVGDYHEDDEADDW